MPFYSVNFTALEVKLGGFALSEDQILMLPLNAQVTDFTDTTIADEGYTAMGEYVYSRTGAPDIGDIRVSYRYCASTDISVLARQTADTFIDYRTESGVLINRVEDGIKPGFEILNIIEHENFVFRWLIRGMAAIFMFLGVGLVFNPLGVVGARLPLLGPLVGAAAGFASFILSLSLCLTIIALSWLAVRPLIGAALLLAVIVLLIFLKRYRRPKTKTIRMETSSGKCPSCGQENNPGANFCVGCGKKL
jgi:hypothetical protein